MSRHVASGAGGIEAPPFAARLFGWLHARESEALKQIAHESVLLGWPEFAFERQMRGAAQDPLEHSMLHCPVEHAAAHHPTIDGERVEIS